MYARTAEALECGYMVELNMLTLVFSKSQSEKAKKWSDSVGLPQNMVTSGINRVKYQLSICVRKISQFENKKSLQLSPQKIPQA